MVGRAGQNAMRGAGLDTAPCCWLSPQPTPKPAFDALTCSGLFCLSGFASTPARSKPLRGAKRTGRDRLKR